MKKIALLFSILSAGALYGMEEKPSRELLLPEIYTIIVQKAIESSDTLNKAIKAINVAHALQGVRYDNLKDFTKLVHMFANKFNKTTFGIALQFGTTTSKEYIKLGEKMLSKDTYDLIPLIKQSADVNFIGYEKATGKISTPLIETTRWFTGLRFCQWRLQLLLDAGANPYFKSLEYGTALDVAINRGLSLLFEQVMKK